ncbi:integumentary mucin C.1-like [Ostrea edulis]|uniref:integumentary mucin C.1-like n=1 Tax=Ostrea edulis TaxID=37623 RepID=UPI0024AF2744|nr:integumentary mucin C.1-like [Ostrea edulis]
MHTGHILLILSTHWIFSNGMTACPACTRHSCHVRSCAACLYHLNPGHLPTLTCERNCHSHSSSATKCCANDEGCLAEAFGNYYSKTFVNCPVCHGGVCHNVKCINCKVNTEDCLMQGTCYIEGHQCHAGRNEICCRDQRCIEHEFSKCHTTTTSRTSETTNHTRTETTSTTSTTSTTPVSTQTATHLTTKSPPTITTTRAAPKTTIKPSTNTHSTTTTTDSTTTVETSTTTKDNFTTTLKEVVSTSQNTPLSALTKSTVSSTTSQSVSQKICKVCGDYENGIPCDIRDVYLGPSVQCPPGTEFCMTDIVHDIAGNDKIFKRCVDETICRNEWLSQTSDQDRCTQFGNVPASGAYSCHFCCTTNDCNHGLLPDVSTFYTR